MNKLILSLSDFLKTDPVEIKTYDYKGDIDCKSDISVLSKAVKYKQEDKVFVLS